MLIKVIGSLSTLRIKAPEWHPIDVDGDKEKENKIHDKSYVKK